MSVTRVQLRVSGTVASGALLKIPGTAASKTLLKIPGKALSANALIIQITVVFFKIFSKAHHRNKHLPCGND